MTEVYHFGSVSGSWAAFAFFAFMAIAIGWLLFYAIGQEEARARLPRWLTESLPVRYAISLTVAMVLLIMIWMWLWADFYRLEIAPNTVILHYHAPERQRVISREDLEEAEWYLGMKQIRKLSVTTREGTTYYSAQADWNLHEGGLIERLGP